MFIPFIAFCPIGMLVAIWGCWRALLLMSPANGEEVRKGERSRWLAGDCERADICPWLAACRRSAIKLRGLRWCCPIGLDTWGAAIMVGLYNSSWYISEMVLFSLGTPIDMAPLALLYSGGASRRKYWSIHLSISGIRFSPLVIDLDASSSSSRVVCGVTGELWLIVDTEGASE